jgi:hypothetical protein
MGDEAAERANELVDRFIMRKFREDSADGADSRSAWLRPSVADLHLAACSTIRVVERDTQAGDCGTGCETATLEAAIGCDCGHRTDWEYGTFGDIASMLEEIVAEEAANSQSPS